MNLSRVLEAEVTETNEEANLYDDMDHQSVNREFVEDLIAACAEDDFPEEETIHVLDLGTGTARIPIELCNQTEDQLKVYAVDMSIPMLDLARINIELSGYQDRIQLDRMDAKALDVQVGERFDVVMSNSLIHHLPDPALGLSEGIRLAAPGGRLFFRDLVRPASAEAVNALVAAHAEGQPAAARQMLHDSLHAALDLDEIRAMIAELGFEPETVQMTSDRHWTWSAKKPNKS